MLSYEPHHEKTNTGFQTGLTQTKLYKHRSRLEAGFRKLGNKGPEMISFEVTAELICTCFCIFKMLVFSGHSSLLFFFLFCFFLFFLFVILCCPFYTPGVRVGILNLYQFLYLLFSFFHMKFGIDWPCCFKGDMSLCMRKPNIWVPTRSDTNRAVQSQKMVRSLKFPI